MGKAGSNRGAAPKHVAVVVLGDIGRSPRMQYHAMSLVALDQGVTVSLIGYKGERCIPAVESEARINQVFVDPLVGKGLRERSFLLFALVKVVALVLQLFWALVYRIPAPDYILVQNPPSIPTLLVVWIASWWTGSTVVIDWHNLGYTVLAMSLGPRHPLVKVSRIYEGFMARRASKHFCVTDALRVWLRENFGIDATVLHDRPPAFFGPTPVTVRHDLFLRLRQDLQRQGVEESFSKSTGITIKEGETIFTELGPDGKPNLREGGRPALLISSTSWTPDEDFSILLEALVKLGAKWQQQPSTRGRPSPPFLVVAVTGKGPQKEMYEKKIRELDLPKIAICTLWLEAEDYPRLVGAATLGVCLHTSTSGIDLPMKVLDMYGCEVPVCAMGFSCLPELVKHQVNGLVFTTSDELSSQLDSLLMVDKDGNNASLQKLREGVKGMARWEANWTQHASPMFADRGRSVMRIWTLRFACMALLAALTWPIIMTRAGRAS